MPVYIESAAAISPQDTFRLKSLRSDTFSTGELQPLPESGFLSALHPEYKQFINPGTLRRMSPVIRMGIAAAKVCLEEAGIENPDAILVGSGLGCVRDTAKFLNQVIDNNEQLLNPTAFIQSTHNTVSGQIALMLGCRKYNLTFSQNSISFETALLDGMLLLEEGEAQNILLGGIDEMVNESFQLMEKSGCVHGMVGEGANFFVISPDRTGQSMARIEGLKILNRCESQEEITQQTISFLASHGKEVEDIDLFLSGRNGDARYDGIYKEVEHLFHRTLLGGYKHLVGEYDTATAFGTWLAVRIMHDNVIPAAIRLNRDAAEAGALADRQGSRPIQQVLLFNQRKGGDFTWTLLSHPER